MNRMGLLDTGIELGDEDITGHWQAAIEKLLIGIYRMNPAGNNKYF